MIRSFPKTCRLTRPSQFRRMSSSRCVYVGDYIVVELRKNSCCRARLGITVSKRFGKAVRRNRFKRIVREAFRLTIVPSPSGIDYHVKPRTLAQGASSGHIAVELISALSSLKCKIGPRQSPGVERS